MHIILQRESLVLGRFANVQTVMGSKKETHFYSQATKNPHRSCLLLFQLEVVVVNLLESIRYDFNWILVI